MIGATTIRQRLKLRYNARSADINQKPAKFRTIMSKRFTQRVRIRLDDVDYVQVLYFPRVAHLCCNALDDFFRDELQLPWPQMLDEHSISMPTVDLHVVYRRPLRFGDLANIAVGVKEIGNRKAIFESEMSNAATGEVTSVTTHTVVFVSNDTWEPIPVPEQYREALSRYKITEDV